MEEEKIKIRTVQGDNLHVFFCPGCGCGHMIDSKRWTWNGDRQSPTISPSILVTGTKPVTDEEAARIMAGEKFEPVKTRCHSFVRNGNIEFLSDCTHNLAGKTVPLDYF